MTDVLRRLLLTGGSARLVGVDVARCVALLGMMATHVLDGVDLDGNVTLSHELFGGRASALFAVLAGVSMALVSGGHHRHRGATLLGDAAGLVVRSVLIGLVGLWLGGLETTVAIILVYYAVLFVVALPFLAVPPWVLAPLAVVWAVVAPFVSQSLRSDGVPKDYVVPSFESLDQLGSLARNLLLDGYYPVLTWVPYVLVGLTLGRLDLRRLSTLAWVAFAGAVAAVLTRVVSAILLASPSVQQTLVDTWPDGPLTSWVEVQQQVAGGLYGTTPTGSAWWLATAGPHSGTPFDLLHTTGTALLGLATCLLVTRVAPRAWQVAFGAGAMTLSLYSLHILMQSEAFGPGSQGHEAYVQQVAVIVVTGAAFAAVRLRGPMEAAVRAASSTTAWAVRRGLGGGPGDDARAQASPR